MVPDDYKLVSNLQMPSNVKEALKLLLHSIWLQNKETPVTNLGPDRVRLEWVENGLRVVATVTSKDMTIVYNGD